MQQFIEHMRNASFLEVMGCVFISIVVFAVLLGIIVFVEWLITYSYKLHWANNEIKDLKLQLAKYENSKTI